MGRGALGARPAYAITSTGLREQRESGRPWSVVRGGRKTKRCSCLLPYRLPLALGPLAYFFGAPLQGYLIREILWCWCSPSPSPYVFHHEGGLGSGSAAFPRALPGVPGPGDQGTRVDGSTLKH